jgi:magnesium chelatase family protein
MQKTSSLESSEDIRRRVDGARQIQKNRFSVWHNASTSLTNSSMNPQMVEKYCSIDNDGKRLLEKSVERLGLSARAYHRVLRLARTIADLAGSDRVEESPVVEAMSYRALDRPTTGS